MEDNVEKIEAYEYPPILHSGEYFYYVNKLSEKIRKDQTILEKYPTLENKIANTNNLLIQHYLLIHGTTINATMAKEYLKYQKDGWFIWLQTYDYVPAVPYNTIDEKFTMMFQRCFDMFFDINRKNKYYQQCISNYKQGNYYACVCCLFPLIENMELQITQFDGEKIFKIKDELMNTHIPEDLNNKEYFDEFVTNMNSFLKENIYQTSKAADCEPKVISRNRILHGIFTRDITNTDCLKLLCIYKSMYHFNDWVKSLAEVKILSENLKKLKEKQNKASN